MIQVFRAVDSKNTFGKLGLFLALFLFLGLFVRPYPEQLVGHMGTRLIDLVLLGLVFYALLASQLSFDKNVLIFIGLLFTFTVIALCSAITASSRLNVPPFGIRDALESVRYLSLAIYVAFGYSIGKSDRFRDSKFLYILTIILGVTFFLSFLQLLIPQYVSIITDLYAPEHQARRIFTTGRVTGIFGNPNTNGLMTLILCSGLLSYYFVYKEKIPRIYRRLFLGLTVFGFLSTLITGSTTTFLSLLILSTVVYLYRTKVTVIRVLLFIFGLIVLFLLKDFFIEYLRNVNMYLYNRVSVLFSINAFQLIKETEFFGRLPRWLEGISIFLEVPFIGAGPLRGGEITSATDNFYLYILMRYGLLGFSLLVIFWLFVLYTVKKSMVSRYSSVRFLGYFVFMQTIIILAANLTLEAQIIIPIAYMYFISLGVLLARINICSKNILKFSSI